jgi:hypothetical protein
MVSLLLPGCGAELGEPSPGVATDGRPALRELDPPSAEGAFAPRLAASESEILLTWWEPIHGEGGATGHRLVFSRWVEGWSEPTVIVEGEGLFANWADFPAVIREPSGSLLVHWLAKTAEATFAYSIELARSTDDGATWAPLGRLNDDSTDTEHGFVSFVPEGEAVRAYWLDGRSMAEGGPMTVRSARIDGAVGASEQVDDRVCECCPTDAVATPEGSLVVYRDRAEDETREIFAVRREGGAFSSPVPATSDGWRIPGCPVNGPAVDHRDGVTALAWFTAPAGKPRVVARFGVEPDPDAVEVVVDADRPLGRVGLAIDGDGTAVVSWLALVGERAELRLRRVSATGEVGEPLVLGRTSGSRASGMPQLARRGESLLAAWVEVSEGPQSGGSAPGGPQSGGSGSGGTETGTSEFGRSRSRLRVREISTTLVPAV